MMKKVFCPETGQQEWANVAGKDKKIPRYRCTKCGREHS